MDDDVDSRIDSRTPQEDDARSAYVFEKPHEAMLKGNEPGSGGVTIEPSEEGPAARGFQHGGWDYAESKEVSEPRTTPDGGDPEPGQEGNG